MSRWITYDLIFFDCDSTLSTIEGIDELARLEGKEDEIAELTNRAMDGELDLSEVYFRRLEMINPTKGQLKAVEEMYYETMVEDADTVIAALQFLGKDVFVISGGLIDAVRGFGRRLGVPTDMIRAVELQYNQLSENWWEYHNPSAQHKQSFLDYNEGHLTVSSGKPNVIKELAGEKRGRKLMIGDGSSDLATSSVVDLFVGYGGVVAREKVEKESEVFIHSASLAPLLPMIIGSTGYRRLMGTSHQSIAEKGVEMALDGAVTFKDDALRESFILNFAKESS